MGLRLQTQAPRRADNEGDPDSTILRKDCPYAGRSTYLGGLGLIWDLPKADMMDFIKIIVSAQRDHGNLDARVNARMKYSVHTLGTDHFRTLVESYFRKAFQAWREMAEREEREIAERKYSDWMG
jgi:hypothetical protein